MLRLRIRELERQINGLNANSGGTHPLPNASPTGSGLTQSATPEHGGNGVQSNAGAVEVAKD